MVSEFKTKVIKGSKTVGQRLTIARKRLHLSLDDAERDTKIRLKYLEAFEDGSYHELPEVYAIGFLRRYAEYLGLKPDPIIALYKNESLTASKNLKKDKKHDFAPVATVAQPQFFITPRSLLIILLAVFIVGLLVYIWVAVRNFSAPPSLAIDFPKSDTVISDDSLEVKGRTDSGTFIFINKEPVNVMPDGTFSQSVDLGEGMNTIVIEAKNRLDHQTVKTIKIVSENPTPTKK